MNYECTFENLQYRQGVEFYPKKLKSKMILAVASGMIFALGQVIGLKLCEKYIEKLD